MALVGVMMKLLSISGSVAIIALALVCLAVIYLVFGFLLFNDIRLRDSYKLVSYRDITFTKVFMSLLSSFVLFTSIAGILFRLMYWNGDVMVLIAAFGLNFLFNVIIAIIISIRSSHFYKNILIRSAILLIIIACLTLTPAKYLDIEKRKVLTEETRLLRNSQ